MTPPPGGVTATCVICGEKVSFAQPDEDVCCASCFTLNLAHTVHLEPPVVRPALGLSTREQQALRNFQRHLARVGEEEPHE